MATHVKGYWVVKYDEDQESAHGFRSVKVTGDFGKSYFNAAEVEVKEATERVQKTLRKTVP